MRPDAAPADILCARPGADGALVVRVSGLEAHLRPSGALWAPAHQALVAADLHLEKGSAYAMRGQMLPPYDSLETLRRLQAEAAALAPRRIILLGDALHDRDAASRLPPAAVEAVEALASGRDLVWVAGNHDPVGTGTLPGRTVEETAFDAVVLRHAPEPGPCAEAAGHLHPAARVRDGRRSVRRRCFVTDGVRIVLPAFGAYAGGLNVRDAAFDGLFTRPPLAVALGGARVFPLAWSRLAPD